MINTPYVAFQLLFDKHSFSFVGKQVCQRPDIPCVSQRTMALALLPVLCCL